MISGVVEKGEEVSDPTVELEKVLSKGWLGEEAL